MTGCMLVPFFGYPSDRHHRVHTPPGTYTMSFKLRSTNGCCILRLLLHAAIMLFIAMIKLSFCHNCLMIYLNYDFLSIITRKNKSDMFSLFRGYKEPSSINSHNGWHCHKYSYINKKTSSNIHFKLIG